MTTFLSQRLDSSLSAPGIPPPGVDSRSGALTHSPYRSRPNQVALAASAGESSPFRQRPAFLRLTTDVEAQRQRKPTAN